jgi:protein TonB
MTPETFNLKRIRAIVFIAVALIHLLAILFFAFNIETIVNIPEQVAGVMKLVDVQERFPPPESPPQRPPEPQTNTQEAIAETFIETDELPPPVGILPEQSTEQIIYLPQHMLSVLPDLPDEEIRRSIIYPPIAERSNTQGTVYLELFIDNKGIIRDIRILKEEPPDKGFGQAAVNAFRGIRGKPAEANGVQVASRFRYVLRFSLK